MDSTRETENTEFESKLSELLPDLAQLLEKHGVSKSDEFTVNFGIDLSELQHSLASHSTMSCYWDASQSTFICSLTCPNEAQLKRAVESKLSEMLPNLGQVLKKHGVSEPFTVNLGIDLSEFASPNTLRTLSCCIFKDGRPPKCSLTYPARIVP